MSSELAEKIWKKLKAIKSGLKAGEIHLFSADDKADALWAEQILYGDGQIGEEDTLLQELGLEGE